MNQRVLNVRGTAGKQEIILLPCVDQLQDNAALPSHLTPAVLKVAEVALMLRIGRNSVYEAIARGEIPAIRLGRRLLVPRTALESLLACSGERTGTVH